jgi:hypothetical protein
VYGLIELRFESVIAMRRSGAIYIYVSREEDRGSLRGAKSKIVGMVL